MLSQTHHPRLPRQARSTNGKGTMNRKELTDALEVVHRELAELENLDSDEVEKLRATMIDIQAVLDQRNERSESLSERVAGSARRFEESHPVLTETLGRVADILQQMGI
jgi:hypothetical protein